MPNMSQHSKLNQIHYLILLYFIFIPIVTIWVFLSDENKRKIYRTPVTPDLRKQDFI